MLSLSILTLSCHAIKKISSLLSGVKDGDKVKRKCNGQLISPALIDNSVTCARIAYYPKR